MPLVTKALALAATLAVAAAQTYSNQSYFDGYETVNSSTYPVQIRLAYSGPTGMTVSWNTFSQLSNPSVQYGTDPNSLTNSASSSISVTYPTSLTYNNHVEITGLSPSTTYYYQPQGANQTYSFTTAKAAGDMSPFTVGVVVDLGTFGYLGLSETSGPDELRPGEQTTITALTQTLDNYDFVVHAGDIAYADAWQKEESAGYLPNTTSQGTLLYEQILNAFYDEMEPITSEKAYMTNAGNHEANCLNGKTVSGYTCPMGQTNFTGYLNHWRMPTTNGGFENLWYSYDHGMVHFVHIDTETDLGSGLTGPDASYYGVNNFAAPNAQVDWLTQDLANARANSATPWIVVFGHRGWYLSATSSICANCQTAFEELLWQYGVDLYINGHAHLYERVTPIVNGTIDPNGLNNPNATLYITTGAAGHYAGLDTFPTTAAPYSVAHEATDYSYSAVTFTDANHLTVNTYWSANNTLFDSATLYRSHVFSANVSNPFTSNSSTSSSVSTSTPTATSTTASNGTATTTGTTATSSFTNYNGAGHLYIIVPGVGLDGDIGSSGAWYNSPGQNIATYTSVPIASNGSTFYLNHGTTNWCQIYQGNGSFGCWLPSSTGATVFGQTVDGNLTYNGSQMFYASATAGVVAGVTTKPAIYATPASSFPVTFAVSWNVASITAASSASSTVSNSTGAQPTATSTSLTFSNTTSMLPTTTSPTSVTSNSSTTSSAAGSNGTATVYMTLTQTVSTTATIAQPTTEVDTVVSMSTIMQTLTQTSTEVDSTTVTIMPTPSTVTLVQTATEVDSTTMTEVDSTTITIVPAASTITVVQTSTETDSTTVTQTATETDMTTFTQPASTVQLPASTVTMTVTQTLPASSFTQTITQTQPALTQTIYVTQPASTITAQAPASTITVTQQAPPASTVTVTQPAKTVTTTTTAPALTLTLETITVTLPRLTITTTSVRTQTSLSVVTQTAACTKK